MAEHVQRKMSAAGIKIRASALPSGQYTNAVDGVELHDAFSFSIAELIDDEALGLGAPGEATALLHSSATTFDRDHGACAIHILEGMH